jgi:hypothetical protein
MYFRFYLDHLQGDHPVVDALNQDRKRHQRATMSRNHVDLDNLGLTLNLDVYGWYWEADRYLHELPTVFQDAPIVKTVVYDKVENSNQELAEGIYRTDNLVATVDSYLRAVGGPFSDSSMVVYEIRIEAPGSQLAAVQEFYTAIRQRTTTPDVFWNPSPAKAGTAAKTSGGDYAEGADA